ncbi:MAG: tRNA pseudouridine(38-40) synthase TruA [Canibacter sp.]
MPELIRLKLLLSYDGSQFSGWAVQPGLRTVQGEIEHAVGKILRRENDVRLTVAGRTDAGVHARGQVAHLDVTPAELEKWTGKATRIEDSSAQSIARAQKLTGVLRKAAPDIVIWRADEVSEDFNARFSALWRRYEYRISVGECDPLLRHMTASVKSEIDFDVLQAASEQLTGLRDFSTFCKAREGATAVRHLTHFEWERESDRVFVARIEADAFCHSMVRALVGAAVAAATGRITADQVVELADAQERSSMFTVMPAHGLSLQEIGYPNDAALAARAVQTRARRDPL